MADKAKTRKIVDLGMQTRVAMVRAASLDEEARTVELVWSTGAQVRRYSWLDGEYIEELSLDPKHVRMGRLRNGAPLLDSHNHARRGVESVLGVVESAELGKGEAVATVRFPAEGIDEDADRILRKVKDGIIRHVSVGYAVHRFEKTEEQGKTPLWRATDWEPYEISLVPMGADDAATVRAEGAGTNPCELVLAHRGADDMAADNKKSESQGKAARAAESAPETPDTAERGAPEPEPAAPEVGASQIRAQERERVSSIHQIARSLELGDEFAARHIKNESTLDEVRRAAIDEKAKGQTEGPRGSIRIDPVRGGDEGDKWNGRAQAAILVRGGYGKLLRKHAKLDDGAEIDLNPAQCRGMSLIDMARHVLERAGVSTRGKRPAEIAELALSMRSAGYQGTDDFAVLMEGTARRVMLADFAVAPDTWRRFCKVGSVSDFREHKRVRVGSLANLSVVPEGAEYQNQDIPDGAQEGVSAKTRGTIIALTRQVMVNDDLDAFLGQASQLGRASARTIEAGVYAMLAENGNLGPTMEDGNPLFDASHNNVGGGAALSASALDDDATLMAEQTDIGGNDYLDIQPSILLVPRSLKGQAMTINAATYSPDAGAALQEPNIAQGLFDEVVGTPRLSGTRRYIFADPADAPVFEVVFLDGQQEPQIQTREGFRVDGREWKVSLDVGWAAIGYRGAVTDAGG